MKICIVSNLYEPYVLGGAEIYVSKIIKYLTEQTKNEVVLITTKPFTKLEDLLIQAEQVNSQLKIYRFYPLNIYHSKQSDQKPMFLRPLWHALDLWNIHSYIQIKKILKRENPDIVHSHNITGFSTSVFTAIKKLKIPHLHTLHDYQLLSPWAMLYKNGKIIDKFNSLEEKFYKTKKRFTKSPNAVLAPSQFTLSKHKEYGFFKNSRLIHLPLGIEASRLDKKTSEEINIVYFGQIVQHKGISLLLEAFSKIKNTNVRLHIAGTGPQLKQLQDMSKTDPRIKFHGFITGKEKEGLWQRADIAVNPSVWYENSPVTIYEGFQSKAALIVSAVGGMQELIDDNKNGLLFKTGDSNDLRKKLQQLINDSELRSSLAENGHRDYIDKYTIGKHFNKLEQIYKNVTPTQGINSDS